MNNLVIVESPAKGRTLEKFLGSEYQVIASMGHVRDLPKSELGIDTEHNFAPQYIIPRAKRKQVNILKKMAESAKKLWLATDPDREGEAIAWHIQQLLNNSAAKRVVFHEITEEAIKEAFTKPRDLDMQLIDAQQARRVLDRLVGYKLSPLLWKKVKSGLSAGRVQSVTLRLIVEREREISAFKAQEYWSIEATLQCRPEHSEGPDIFIATLISLNNKKLVIKNQQEADTHVKNLGKADYAVLKIIQKQVKKYPSPPFTTSTMQQAGVNKLGFTSKKTMKLAQDLYERGLITYMRTDSLNLAPSAVSAVRQFLEKEYGKNYVPPTPRFFKTKSKNAQEAHEAIRPTNVQNKSSITKDHDKLYDLIWKRFVACQMSEALVDQTTIDISAGEYLLRVTGSVIKFDGWLKIYGKSDDEEEKILPELHENEKLNLIKLIPSQHFTEPPARFTEASLIKTLEELGIGRPSTYAPIISTIKERFYVEVEEKKFIPTALGFAVSDFIVKYFPEIVDYKFTAKMEDELDEIARGERQWVPVISEFYTPFEKKLESVGEKAEKVQVAVEFAGRNCPECKKELIVRIGRFGKFLACSGFPDCKHTESLEEKLSMPCPEDGGEIVVRHTKKRRVFYGCKNWPTCKFASWTKPQNMVS